MSKIEDLWEKIFNKIADRVMGPTPSYKDSIIVDYNEFLKKLLVSEAMLNVVADPYELAFYPDYLLWFEDNKDTFYCFLSPNSEIWRIIYKEEFGVSFPSKDPDHPWLIKIPWSTIEKNKLNLTS